MTRAQTRASTNPWAALTVLCLSFFMILLDTTIVNIAIPSMIDGLHASLDAVLWIVNAYILVFAVLLITAGRLGDIYGQRRLFVVGLVVFTVASAACGLAQSPGQLVAARILQGVGGALLTPQTLAILTTIFPPDRRGAAFGAWGAVAGVAAIAGPTLGGLLVTDVGWRWIFFVNLPVGVATVAATYVFVPDVREGRAHHLDLRGVLLASCALFGITFGLIEGQRYDWGRIWGPLTIPEIIAAGVVLMAVFVLVQRRETREPLLPFELLRQRNFALMNVVNGAMMFAMMGLFLPLTIYLQSVLGFSALEAGLTVAPMSAISMVVAPVAGRLADRFGGKYLLLLGLAMYAVGMAVIVAVAGPASGQWDFLAGYLVGGFGVGCIFAPIATMAMFGVPPRLAGAASGIFNTTRQLGGVIGSAAVGAVLQTELTSQLATQARDRAGLLPGSVPPAGRRAVVDAFRHAGGSGLEVGAGQSGLSAKPPPGTPAAVVRALDGWAHDVFTHAFVGAMRSSLILPIAVLAVGMAATVGIRRARATGPADLPVAEVAPVSAGSA